MIYLISGIATALLIYIIALKVRGANYLKDTEKQKIRNAAKQELEHEQQKTKELITQFQNQQKELEVRFAEKQKFYEDETKRLINAQNLQISFSEKEIQAVREKVDEAKTRSTERLAELAENESLVIQHSQERIDSRLKEHFKDLAQRYAADTQKASFIIRQQIAQEIDETSINAQNIMIQLTTQIADQESKLNDYYQKQKVINEEILRRRALEENTDFYRLNIAPKALRDIHILEGVREQLENPLNLNKMIYDTYISKPASEMVKRILKGKDSSGIYKITRLKTGEIYIGKSTHISQRWIQHLKTAYSIGSIAHSILHTTMEKDGVENFTFELLEEVTKDKLSEREKYWIGFYGAREYGLNERS